MAPKKKTYGTTRSGRTIDDDLVDELAAKAERGYDVDETLRRRGGRPPIGSGPATIESVRLDLELRRARRARRTGSRVHVLSHPEGAAQLPQIRLTQRLRGCCMPPDAALRA